MRFRSLEFQIIYSKQHMLQRLARLWRHSGRLGTRRKQTLLHLVATCAMFGV